MSTTLPNLRKLEMSAGPPTWFMLGTLAVAVIAPTVAFIVASRQVEAALKVARQQAQSAERVAQKSFQGSVVAANRQKWLDELRSDVAAFASEVMVVRGSGAAGPAASLKAVHFSYSRVRMRINSSKPEQKYLVDQMQVIMADVRATDTNAKLEALMSGVEEVAAGVWRRIKAGD